MNWISRLFRGIDNAFVLDSGQKHRRDPIVVTIVFAAWLGLLVVSVSAGIGDYTTSLLGLLAVPTAKVDDTLTAVMALLPQLLSVVAFFAAGNPKEKRVLWGTVFVFAQTLDIGTDIYFKTYAWTQRDVFLFALFETVFFYSLGSEMLFVAALANIGSYWPDVHESLEPLATMLGQIANAAVKYLVIQPTIGLFSVLIIASMHAVDAVRAIKSGYTGYVPVANKKPPPGIGGGGQAPRQDQQGGGGQSPRQDHQGGGVQAPRQNHQGGGVQAPRQDEQDMADYAALIEAEHRRGG